ncbi:hypothetical protein BV509_09085 [Rhodovulum sulfidophilum]|uniref:Uncharacterized protein n=1 Tax=Rhodovulum visakhapatnamense TaxID=364297 RepID=A0ABS1RHU8_9RHOB|nr:hypothetical protein [Rhodovulum visakhapatnamense]MBL3568864.1 hypothetical protein [Rhodovulum visakhapatnamense]MBL3579228.1 hypothetical protein [Rhodovulum visakhapatnamense]OLS44480.1 hypothetical protein BV509_09085 [Rhodovulum sulfidophilum]
MFSAADLDLEDLFQLKPKGFYRVENRDGRTTIIVHRPGEPVEIIGCLSLGHANQVRQRLTDEGLTGFVEGAR